MISQEKAVGRVYVLDQKNPGLKWSTARPPASSTTASSRPHHQRSERLTAKFFKDRPEKGQEWITSRLEGLSGGMGLPVILVEVHENPLKFNLNNTSSIKRTILIVMLVLSGIWATPKHKSAEL